MSTVPFEPADDDFDALAGEYVLGLLDAGRMVEAADLRQRDARFEAAVLAWEARLMPIADTLAPVAPSAALWAKIDAAIAPPKAAPVRLWDSLKFWRYFSLGAGAFGAAGLAAALVLALSVPKTAITPVAVATLNAQSAGAFVATAQMTGRGTQLVISPSNVILPAGKAAELWLILPGSKPQALGLLPSDHPVVVNIAAPLTTAQIGTAALAVTIEPPGGAAPGGPAGPLMSSAKFSLL